MHPSESIRDPNIQRIRAEKMMTDSKEKILSQFEPDVAVKLLEFGHTISEQDCDYFLFMSRKFCCLYDILQAVGMPPVKKPIVSDKILDLNLAPLRDKNIILVDDIVICGTTIWKTVDKLSSDAHIASIRTSVFCVNEKWWAQKCVKPDYKAVVLSDDRAMTFCTNIVSALSIAPRPYAVDYPLFFDVEVKTRYWNRILSSKEWTPFDISTSLQEEYRVGSLTYFPSSVVAESLRASFGERLAEALDIVKVRVYTEELAWGIRMTILPIVTFKPIHEKYIAQLFDAHLQAAASILDDREMEDHLRTNFPTPTSKLRLLQFSGASIVAAKFKEYLQSNQEREIKLAPRSSDIELLFGKWNLSQVAKLVNLYTTTPSRPFALPVDFRSSVVELEQTEISTLLAPTADSAIGPRSSQNGAPRNIIADFNNIFLALYNKKELPTRKMVLKASAADDWESIRRADRLETGITFRGILEYLKEAYGYELTARLKDTLSLVLDYSIDKGIAVPLVRFNSNTGLVYRAYRHGEDVPFTDAEAELCGLAIEEAQKILGQDSLPKLFLEKLIVLLIRIGAATKFLEVEFGTSGEDGLAKIGFYLQGAVAMYRGPDLHAETDIWLSKYLLEKGVMRQTQDGRYTFGQHIPSVQIKSTSPYEAQKLGTIIALLYKGVHDASGSPLQITDDDLILLSTCWRIRDVAAALNIELFLFRRDLFPILSQFLGSSHTDGNSNFQASLRKILSNRGYIALNSLHMKYIGWIQNLPREAVSKGETILAILNQRPAALDWKGYWAALSILIREDEEKKFSDHITRMAEIGHRILFYIDLMEAASVVQQSIHEKHGEASRMHISVAFDKLERYVERCTKNRPSLLTSKETKAIARLISLREDNFKKFVYARILAYISERILLLNSELTELLDLVSLELRLFEKRGDSISYKHVLYYDIVDSTATKRISANKEIEEYRMRISETKKAINSILRALEQEADQEKEEVYCWNGDITSTNDAKYVFFTGKKVGFGLRRVADFVTKLLTLSNDDIHFRLIISPCDVFHSSVFRHVLKTEVDGPQFWEHFSRIQKKFKELELTHGGDHNLILTLTADLGEEIIRRLPRKMRTSTRKSWQDKIETRIAGLYCTTESQIWVL